MSGQLMTHCGASSVSRDELSCLEAPPGTSSWHPIRHVDVLDRVESMLADAGFEFKTTALAVSHEGNRFFGVLDLSSPLVDGVCMSVGVRNSNDKTFPIGFCCGTRTFVCDNLAFSSEIVISKRHTRFGSTRFAEGIGNAIGQLGEYHSLERQRIEVLQQQSIADETAESLILRSAERGIIGWRLIPRVLQEWREPSHDEFRPRTAYSLLNAYTEILKPRFRSHPHRAAAETIALQAFLAA